VKGLIVLLALLWASTAEAQYYYVVQQPVYCYPPPVVTPIQYSYTYYGYAPQPVLYRPLPTFFVRPVIYQPLFW
jgi:hypothetical protein